MVGLQTACFGAADCCSSIFRSSGGSAESSPDYQKQAALTASLIMEMERRIDMNLGIVGKVAVVTGAGQGIGRSTALTLAAEGAYVCVNDVNPGPGEQTARNCRDLGTKAIYIRGDVSKESEVIDLFLQVEEKLGLVEILVNNAGISPKVLFEDIPVEQLEQVVAVNLLGPFLCSQQAVIHMKKMGWGRIVNLSSISGRYGADKSGVHYSAAKAGIIGMTITLAKKLGPYSITVNCVAPGRINTALTFILPPEEVEELRCRIPLRRIGEPEEVASVIAFLTSQPGAYVSGTCVDITGGYIA